MVFQGTVSTWYRAPMTLRNIVFQGTVTGPTLWNLFFEDARHAINECFYNEIVFADDSNAYRIYPSAAQNDAMKRSLNNCQRELHKWGDANQVVFDACYLHQTQKAVRSNFSASLLALSFLWLVMEAENHPSHEAFLHRFRFDCVL